MNPANVKKVNGSERRQHERLPAQHPVTLYLRRGVLRTPYRGQVKDVSLGGCQVSTHEGLDLEDLMGSTLDISLALDRGGAPLDILGLVRWVDEPQAREADARWRAGIQFLGLRSPEPALA